MSAPPYQITSEILDLVARISEGLGRLDAFESSGLTPALRRANRIRTIQGSLAIENNTLSLEQVTAIIEGRRILGPPQDIHEVKNAFSAYELLNEWSPTNSRHLLAAHQHLMDGIIPTAGKYRTKGVGIAKGSQLVHLAPPAANVRGLMKDLLMWLRKSKAHPLIASSVFHYELEFIHPFADGNGRMGRLWQTLILSRWKPLFAYLPVETVICDNQDAYYAALSRSDKAGQSTEFIAFILSAISKALEELKETDQVSDQVSDQVKVLLKALGGKTMSAAELMKKLNLRHRPTFRKNYLNPALEAGFIERTIPDKPRSQGQKYRVIGRVVRPVP